MPKRIACPSCGSSNAADALRCHTCARELAQANPPTDPSATDASVTLQRVMGGEVYTALPADRGKGGDAHSEPQPQASVARGEGLERPAIDDHSDEDHSDILAAAIDRIRARAKDAGHKFKPYVPAKHRPPPKPGAREEIAMQLDVAMALFRERRFEEAIEPLLKAIARDDEDRKPWILLGDAYLRSGRMYKAAVGFLRALELSPKDEQAWLGLSRVLRAVGEVPTASSLLDRAIAIHPEHSETWLERGLVRESMQDWSEASRSFDRVLSLRPDHRLAQAKRDELEARQSIGPKGATAGPYPSAHASTTMEVVTRPAVIGDDFLIAEIERRPVAKEAAEVLSVQRDEIDAPLIGGPDRRARIPTYVEGLDETLDGGIPRGHVVLVEGAPGTLKSSLAFSILLQNASRDGIHCLYLSLEERASSLLRQMGSLGLPLDVRKGSLVVLDPRASSDLLSAKADWVEALEKGIRSIKEQRGLDLIAIDSLEALEVLAKFKDRRREMYRLFEWLRDLDVTSLVIAERPDWIVAGHVLQGRWDEDFLADGVIHLRTHMVSDLEAQRRLRMVKLRGTKHETGYLVLVLDEGRFRVTRTMSP